MDEEDQPSPSEFCYPEDLETCDTETETCITDSQEAIDDFINQQKSANTNKKTVTHMNTLLRYIEANGVKNEKIESFPASELDHDEDALFETGEFGDSNPVALQRTVWWLSLRFGFRARDESRKLRCGDVELEQQNDGQEVLVWLAELCMKTRHGQARGHQSAFQPKVFATNTARWPVSFYKKFRSHRPVEMSASESPFYLAVRNNRRSNEEVWYMKAPLEKK